MQQAKALNMRSCPHGKFWGGLKYHLSSLSVETIILRLAGFLLPA
jgi:hypothetical protein